MTLKLTAGHSRRSGRRRRESTLRPLVEVLETRLAPAAFTVNTTMDTVAANLTTGQDLTGNVSLRSAIMAANHLGGSNTITLPANTYGLTIDGSGEDDAAT